MKNQIIINAPRVNKSRIEYFYSVSGEWSELFYLENTNYIEYSLDIENVPKSILIIPFLANILPVAWVCDAEVVVEDCDKEFVECVLNIKKGYCEMHPSINFGGKLIVKNLIDNTQENTNGAISFFSGGVDAFSTLVTHAGEHPTLVTLLGADLTLDDTAGWEKVVNHIKDTCQKFDTDYVLVKSTFRSIYDQHKLTEIVKESKDNWWHGFQHGIGIISHAAPIAYAMKKEIVYFASSFTIAEKGKVTCASDPTIDNNVKFCSTSVWHDGYDYNRQAKIKNITEYSKANDIEISLRVCWESAGGSNCCNCEKCFRTMLGIYAQGFDPHDFGFEYDDLQLEKITNTLRYGNNKFFSELRYAPIQNAMRENIKKKDLPKALKWFYSAKISDLNRIPLSRKIRLKIYSIKTQVYRIGKKLGWLK